VLPSAELFGLLILQVYLEDQMEGVGYISEVRYLSPHLIIGRITERTPVFYRRKIGEDFVALPMDMKIDMSVREVVIMQRTPYHFMCDTFLRQLAAIHSLKDHLKQR
jgi:hypothetical protein